MPETMTATVHGRTYQLTADTLDLMMVRHLPASPAALRERIAKAGGPGGRFDTVAECLVILALLDGYATTAPDAADAERRTADVLRQNETRRAAMGLTDDSDEDGEQGCEGHYDDDHNLMAAGIGEPTYCDGSCNPRR